MSLPGERTSRIRQFACKTRHLVGLCDQSVSSASNLDSNLQEVRPLAEPIAAHEGGRGTTHPISREKSPCTVCLQSLFAPAYLIDGVVGCRKLVANGDQQVELLLVVVDGRRQPWDSPVARRTAASRTGVRLLLYDRSPERTQALPLFRRLSTKSSASGSGSTLRRTRFA
jgi:hypothetical protein